MLIPIEKPKETCRLFQGVKCCAYLVMGGDGFECVKGNDILKETIDGRLLAKSMNAQGIGDWKECVYAKNKT